MNAKPSPLVAAILLVTLLSAAVTTRTAQAVDRIQRRNGNDAGEITSVTPLVVTISKGGVETKIPVEEIRTIRFSSEPAKLTSARKMVGDGRYQQALKTLQQIPDDDLKTTPVKQEAAFLKILSTARRALESQDNLAQASREAADFLAKHRNSYHLTQALELAGDLALAANQPDDARKQYAKLAKAPSPYFKSRSAILIGRAFQSQNQHDQALAEFDKALKLAGDAAVTASQRTAATLWRAVSLSATGSTEAAVAAIRDVIASADQDDTQLLAQAYNLLGDCYLQTDDPRSARNAYLHVDLLFADVAQQHAKALYELSQVWNTLGHQKRADEARQRLQEEYPTSPWAKR